MVPLVNVGDIDDELRVSVVIDAVEVDVTVLDDCEEIMTVVTMELKEEPALIFIIDYCHDHGTEPQN